MRRGLLSLSSRTAGFALAAALWAPLARADGAPAAPCEPPSKPWTPPAPCESPSRPWTPPAPCPSPCPAPWWEDTRYHGTWATVTVEHGFDADLQSTRGSLSFTRGGLALEWDYPVASKWSTLGALYVEEDVHDFSDPDAIVAGTGRLFEEGRRVRFEPQLRYVGCSGWGVSAGPIVQSSGVPGAKFEDTVTWGGKASVRIPLGGSTAIDLGVSVETQLETSPSVWPVFDFESASSKSRFHLGYLRTGVGSTGIRASYDLTPTFAVSALGRLEYRAWRLAEDDRVPGGVFRQARSAPGLGVMWNPSSCVSLSGEAWWTIGDGIRIDDRSGHRVTDFGVGAALELGLTLSVRF